MAEMALPPLQDLWVTAVLSITPSALNGRNSRFSDFGAILYRCGRCANSESNHRSGLGLVSTNASVTKPRYTL